MGDRGGAGSGRGALGDGRRRRGPRRRRARRCPVGRAGGAAARGSARYLRGCCRHWEQQRRSIQALESAGLRPRRAWLVATRAGDGRCWAPSTRPTMLPCGSSRTVRRWAGGSVGASAPKGSWWRRSCTRHRARWTRSPTATTSSPTRWSTGSANDGRSTAARPVPARAGSGGAGDGGHAVAAVDGARCSVAAIVPRRVGGRRRPRGDDPGVLDPARRSRRRARGAVGGVGPAARSVRHRPRGSRHPRRQGPDAGRGAPRRLGTAGTGDQLRPPSAGCLPRPVTRQLPRPALRGAGGVARGVARRRGRRRVADVRSR